MSSEELNKQKSNSDEIDLIELFNRMGNSIKKFFVNIFKYFFEAIFFVVKFLYKNAVQIGIFTIIGFIAGGLFYFLSDKQYSSDMVASSNSLRNDEMISYINNLDELCKSKNYLELGNYLKIDQTTASKIKSIRAYWGFDRNRDGLADYIDYSGNYDISARDTIQKRLWDRFYVKAVVTDEYIFTKLKTGVYNYIINNPYVLEMNETRLKQQTDMIGYINAEIKKLDSLEKFEYFNQNRIIPQVGANQTILFTEKDRKLYHKDIFDLYSQRNELETKITVKKDPITVIQDFTPLSKVENTLISYIIKYGIAGFLLGIIAMFFWLYGKKIHKALTE